jgi:hypothetical protein
MAKRFKGIEYWCMCYTPDRAYFSIFHAYSVALAGVAGYNIALVAESTWARDLAILLPFITAALPLILTALPMHDNKNWKHRTITFLISVGPALLVACLVYVFMSLLLVHY